MGAPSGAKLGEDQRISADFDGQQQERPENQENHKCLKTQALAFMPEEGLEPSRDFSQGILSPQRLPIPPLGLSDCE